MRCEAILPPAPPSTTLLLPVYTPKGGGPRESDVTLFLRPRWPDRHKWRVKGKPHAGRASCSTTTTTATTTPASFGFDKLGTGRVGYFRPDFCRLRPFLLLPLPCLSVYTSACIPPPAPFVVNAYFTTCLSFNVGGGGRFPIVPLFSFLFFFCSPPWPEEQHSLYPGPDAGGLAAMEFEECQKQGLVFVLLT